MSNQSQSGYVDDTIDLVELFQILWKRKTIIIAVSLLFGIIAGIIAFVMEPKYEISALVQPVKRDQGGAASSLASRFGGMAALAGINLGGGGDDSTVAIATLKSRHLVTSFIDEENLLPILFHKKWDSQKNAWMLDDDEKPPTLWQGHKFFKEEVMRLSEDPETGLVGLSIIWTSPDVAVDWANKLLKRVNAYLQEKAKNEAARNLAFLQQQMANTKVVEIRTSISGMISSEMERAMMANVSDDYAFKIIDPASEPDLDDFTSPKRLLMIALGIILGGIFGVLGVLVREMRSIKTSTPIK